MNPRQASPRSIRDLSAQDERGSSRNVPGRDERGAALVLAIVFVLVVSMAILALMTLGGGSFLNTANLRAQRAVEYSSDSAADAAVQAVRYSYNAYATPGNCLPVGVSTMTISGVTTRVECSGSPPAQSSRTRVVNFYACQAASCTATNAIVHAQVAFNDYSAAGAYSCSASSTTTCGTGMSIDRWTVKTASH